MNLTTFRSIAAIILLLTLAAAPARAARLPAVDKNGKFDIYWFLSDPYLALAASASIYECEFISKSTEGGLPQSERGSIILKVTHAIYGPSCDELVAPYWVPGFVVFSGSPLPWESFDSPRVLG